MAAPIIHLRQFRLLVAIAAVHILAWYAYLSHVPLGLYPTLQEAAVMETAFALAEGRADQAHSATAYEHLLSIPARFVSTESGLALFARLIHGCALVLSAAVCAGSAGLYWNRKRAFWIAGLTIALNPVLAFWSADVSPTLLAVLCSSLAFAVLLRWLRRPTLRRSLVIGLLLGLGVALETSLILFLIAWPICACLYPNRKRLSHFGAALLFPALAFFLFTISGLQLETVPELDVANLAPGIYETFNNHEIHEGKSYSVHQRLNLFLMLNPLHWGLVFIAALCGTYIRFKNRHDGHEVATFIICLGIFALGYALNDAGSQARALLYPVLATYAGGVCMMPQLWSHASKLTKRKLIAGILLAAVFCYSDFYGRRANPNWEADTSYLAKANLALERHQTAAEWAQKTLQINHERDDMRNIIQQTVFYEWALSPKPSPLSIETTKHYLDKTRQADTKVPHIRAIEALYLYKLGQSEPAIRIWQEVKDESALALVCLYWAGHAEKPGPEQVQAYRGAPYHELLQVTARINREAAAYSEGEQILDNLMARAF